MNAKVIGKNVRALRKRKGLSQTQLGEALFLCQTRISRLEKGERVPPADVLERLGKFFEVTIEDLGTIAGLPLPPVGPSPAPVQQEHAEYRAPRSDSLPLSIYLDIRKESRSRIRYLENLCKELTKTIRGFGDGLQRGGVSSCMSAY